MPYRPGGGSLRVLPARPASQRDARRVRGGIIAILIGLVRRDPPTAMKTR